MATKAQMAEQQRSAEWLKKHLKPGDTVYTILRHISRSGVTRHVGVLIFADDMLDLRPDYHVSTVCGYRLNKDGDGLVTNTVGMDVGAEIVSILSYRLFGDSYALRQRWL